MLPEQALLPRGLGARQGTCLSRLFSLMCLLVHTSPDDVSQAALGSGVNNLMSKFLSSLFYIRLLVSASDYKNRVEMS